MMLACYGMFGLSLVASLIIITLIWSRLARHKIGAVAMVPTLWIVLGPLGQSITAVNLLGGNAHLVVDPSWAHALELFGVIYGVPVLGFALLWGALAVAITVRTARQGLPFALTWWSFTFPVGTCVTGVTGARPPHRCHRARCPRGRALCRFGCGVGDRRGAYVSRGDHPGTLLAPPQPA